VTHCPTRRPVQRRILLLGGSFDPVHNGHVALGAHFTQLLRPDELRLIPAGNPWQKQGLDASAQDRVAMLARAFENLPCKVVIDQREILRDSPSYTIDSLREIRAEEGVDAMLAFLLGADQLQRLDTWREWQKLLDYAHLCAASRPGFDLAAHALPAQVGAEFGQRNADIEEIRNTSHGLTCVAANLAVDVSATAIRAMLEHGQRPQSLVPDAVLDYIDQHHLYKN